ncbi:DoxX family protein [Paracoccus sp. (in: a-proteobacteria)]|uniref:DoxX family protein n=1 Tax=Paracoccus sp. TaxID=267 RepID=UPI003A89BD01
MAYPALGPTTGLIRGFNDLMGRVPADLVLLMARLFPATIFWASGRTKVEGFSLSPSALYLFEQEYALPLIPPEIAARLAATAEHVFPVLLILGLMTRLSALALLGMTAIIQIFVYPSAWQTHGLWATCLLILLAKGPGAWSVDALTGLDQVSKRVA